MHAASMYTPLKVVALVVLLLMVGAAFYSGYIAVIHWSGITV